MNAKRTLLLLGLSCWCLCGLHAQSSRLQRAAIDSLKNEIARIRDSIRIADITRNTNLDFLQQKSQPTEALSLPENEKPHQERVLQESPQREPQRDIRRFETEISENISDDVLIRRLSDLNCPFPLPYREETRKKIKDYVSSRTMLASWLERADYWFPLFEEALSRHGLPSELKYLAVIESTLIPTAQSRTDAYGLWQFVHGTADLKLISLQRTAWRDDRFDPYLATEAAAKLLKSDFEILGSWPLTILSYNCGATAIRRALREAASDNFWDVWEKLDRNEPKDYIFLYVAALYAMSYAEEHGIIGAENPRKTQLDTLHIRQPLHFVQISELGGISLEDLRFYNPQYRQDYIKGQDIASKTAYEVLRLPLPVAERVLALKDSLYYYKRDSLFFNEKAGQATGTVLIPRYKVERYRVGEYGLESAEDIARHFSGISAADIVRWNALPDATTPLRQSTVVMLQFPNEAAGIHNDTAFRKHMIQKGETLSVIARKYRTTVDELVRINPGVIKDRNNVPSGLVINLPSKK